MQAGTIALILNVVFVLMLIFGFLFGMWRGVKKAAINLVFSLIGVVVAFFCCGMVTNAIMNITVTVNGEPSTLAGFLSALFSGSPDIQHLIETTPNIEKLIANLPYAICNVVVFIVFAFAVEFVMYILYKIFSAIFVKKKDKDGNKLPKRRIAGGVVGLIKTAVVSMIMLMPFVSLIGTASDLTNTSNDIYAEEISDERAADGILGNVMPNVALQVIDGLNTSAFGVIGNMFGLDNIMFDYLSAFKLDDETVYIRQEIANYNDVYSSAMQLKLIFEGKTDKKFKDINFDKLDKTIDSLFSSTIYKTIVADVLDNIIVNYEEYSFITPETFGDYFVVFEDVSKSVANYENGAGAYLADDLRSVYTAYKELATSGALDAAIAGKNVEDILSIISGQYLQSFEKSLYGVLSTNIVKDSMTNLVNILVSNIIEDADKVNIDSKNLTEEELKELSSSIAEVVNSYCNIAKDVDLISFMTNPLDILSNENETDVEKAFNSLGSLIDNVREIKIFQTAEGNSILDKLLTEKGFKLPETEVTDNNGEKVAINNYTQLMQFVTPSLKALKEIGVYNLLVEDNVSTTDILEVFANASENNKDILSEILLPLYQVEPTKTLLVENLLNTLDKDFIDFTVLASYDDWKGDLGYISTLLNVLNKGSVDGKTYLQVMFDKGANEMLLNLGSDVTITQIMKPMLYAKSTNGLKQKLFNSFEEVFNALTFEGGASSIKFDFTKVTLVENNPEDQTQQICDIFEKFLAFYGEYQTSSNTLKDLDKIKLGQFLDAMKVNAYRTTLEGKSEEGLFKVGFTNLIEKVKTEFNLNLDTDYAHTDFTKLFTELANLEQGA